MQITDWEFKHSMFTQAKKKDAWAFLSDMSNQVRLESAVENIELDGPFMTGTKGRTIMKEYTQEWKLDQVIEGEQFTIVGHNPDLTLSFSWIFQEEGSGTRLSQHIQAKSSQVEKYQEIFRGMEANVPQQMKRLGEELDRLAR